LDGFFKSKLGNILKFKDDILEFDNDMCNNLPDDPTLTNFISNNNLNIIKEEGFIETTPNLIDSHGHESTSQPLSNQIP
jgi:hypothetical protein